MTTPTAERGLRQAVVALRHRNFALFWTGALISNSGTWMQNVTVPYVLYKATGSASLVGIAAFLQFFPGVVLGPVAGHIADHFSRRTVLLATQAVLGVVAFVLWGLWLAGVATPTVLLAVVTVGGIVNGINIPSWQAFVSELVPREALLNAITLNSAQFNGARAIGPAIGGLVLGRWGPSWAFLVNGISYVAVLVALALIRGVRVVPVRTEQRRVLSGFKDSIEYARRHTGILLAYGIVCAVAFLGNPIFQLTPVFATKVFHVGASRYGLLTAALGGGAVLGAVALGSAGNIRRRSRLVRFALLGYSLTLVGFGIAPNFWLAVVAIAMLGTLFLWVVATLNTSVQLLVAEEMRGRVLALYIMVFTASYPLGSLVQGAIADAVGPRWTVAGAGRY